MNHLPSLICGILTKILLNSILLDLMSSLHWKNPIFVSKSRIISGEHFLTDISEIRNLGNIGAISSPHLVYKWSKSGTI